MDTSPDQGRSRRSRGAPSSQDGVPRSPRRVLRRARLLAWISLASSALLLALVVVFLVRNGIYVLLGLVGVLIGTAGGWWVVARRSAPRALGVAGVLVGAALIAGSLLGAGDESWASVIRLVVSIAALAIATLAARAALAGWLSVSTAVPDHASPPRRPVLLCNPWSGGGKVERFGITDLASSLGVETVMLDRGLDLGELAHGAVARGADCLGMAGGDGSQALVASLSVEHDLPFVCVSAGTRNHFALDLGLDRDDPRKSVYAFRDAIERRVDYATVNDRFFVNNVSLGVYATIVQQEGYRGAKAQTTQELLPALLGRDQPFDLQFVTPDGREVDGAFLIMVSNNPYVLAAAPDASQRRRLDSGRLGVFAVQATTGAQAAEVVTLALAGRADTSNHAHEFTCDEFEVRSRSGWAYAGIDGEALQLETPLRFRIHPLGLRLLVPEGNVEASLQRRARNVRLGDLLRIAGQSDVEAVGVAGRVSDAQQNGGRHDV
jgi:diacylglycerol kinase family enzyme